jgi:hypothetical protein
MVVWSLKHATYCSDIRPQQSPCNLLNNATLLQDVLAYLGPVIAVCGVILAWVYQQASARLGIVDLFASEIGTICRVITIMDYATQLTKSFYDPPEIVAKHDAAGGGERKFTSEEEYFPIFTNNARDLQVLDARVVTHITAFYTYMKAMRDSLRNLAQIPHLPDDDEKTGPWHVAKRNVIYMQFLGLESARKAVRDLVEYEPDNAERIVTILLSELTCYGLLIEQFDKIDRNEMRYRRLELRREQYNSVLPPLSEKIYRGWREAKETQSEKLADWLKATRLFSDLVQRAEHCRLAPEVMNRMREISTELEQA